MVLPLFGLHHQIIDIALDFFVEHIVKNCLRCPLVSCSCILKYEGHHLIAKNAFRCAERCGLLILWRHQNLIVSCGTIHEWQCFMSCGWVNHEFYDRQREIIFWTSIVEIPEIHTNTNLPIFLPDRHDVCVHVGYSTSRMNPTCITLLTSFSIFGTNSGRKCRRGCFLGEIPLLIDRRWTATFGSNPGIYL